MIKFKTYKFDKLYTIDSGISTKPEQAGKGSPFLSFSTIFNNYFIPEDLNELMETSEEEQKKYSIEKGDIFLTRTSETADELAMSCVALRNYPRATYSGFSKRLRPIVQGVTDEKFMGFYLRSPYFRKTIQNNTIMTLRASFNENIFSYLKLHLPDYSVQKKIGNLLYSIEKKIEINNKIKKELEEIIKTIYDYWFVQFDFPNENGSPYKSTGGEMIWSKKLKREIPIEWNVQTVANNELTTIIKPGVEKFITKTYLATSDIMGTNILKGNIIEYDNRENRANMQPKINTVWFAKMKNSIKHLFLNNEMNCFINNSILSTGFCGLECTEESFEYISSFISNNYFENIKDILSHGATQQAINNNDLNYIFLIIPKNEILIKYHEKVRSLYSKKSKIICENQKLSNLKNWLLPMLMNGQIQIK